jgi:hypothetical protein
VWEGESRGIDGIVDDMRVSGRWIGRVTQISMNETVSKEYIETYL